MSPSTPHSRKHKLRIIAGSLRGSRLEIADSPGLRPTPERLRETLFNWLAPVITGSRCLDLFAGSGALGIEAASRGAGMVRAVERDGQVAAALRHSVHRLKLDDFEVLCQDALRYLQVADMQFNLVFVDPPFDLDLWQPVLKLLQDKQWLAPGARVFVETPNGYQLQWPEQWTLLRESTAGASCGRLLQADSSSAQ